MSDLNIELLSQFLDALDEGETNLEGLLAHYPEQVDELLPLLQLVQRLEAAPPATPRAEFRRIARARLLARLPEQSAVTFGDRLRHIWQTSIAYFQRRVAMSWIMVFVTLLGLVVGGGGVAYAANDALPGDTFYPIKTTIEVARLGLANDAGDFDLYLKYADTRISELERLIQEGRFEDLPLAAQGFEDSLQNLERLRARLGPNGETYGEAQAVRLRECLEMHARILQGILDEDGEIVPLQAQQRIRQMIQLTVQVQNFGPPEGAGPHGDGPPDEAGPQGQGAPDDAGPQGDGPPDDAGPVGDGQPDGNNNQGDGAPDDPGQNGQGPGAGGEPGGAPGNGNESSGGNRHNGGN